MLRKATLVAALVLLVAAAPSEASTQKVKTKRGELCKFRSTGSHSGGSIDYSLVSQRCRAPNVRRVRALGNVERLDVPAGEQPIEHFFRAAGTIPFRASSTYDGAAAGGNYRIRFEFTVILRRSRWSRAGRLCRVVSTNYPRDTLKCRFLDRV